jgi:DNA primase
MRVPQETIDAIRAATNVVEVIGEFIPLVPAGQNLKGLCPFHEEKTPSFIVSPARQTYHCFGCGAGGNVFSFLKQHQGLEFREALELLAGRAGILLPEERGAGRADAGAGGGPGRILMALGEAATLFERKLWEEGGTRARAYLEGRGLREETVRGARLGYAPPGFDHLRRRLGATYDQKTLIAAGLLVEKGPDRTYDRFRDRLMFPIAGPGGRILGFGARSLDGSEPKYLNTPETAVYHKREVLYGLEAARPVLARRGTAWVVEGYMDVLALQQAGFGEVVAVSGTALTDSHARILRRHVPRVVLLFDGDEAGRNAILRSLPPLLTEGFAVSVTLLPPGEDPDSLVRQGGPEALKSLVAGATSVVSFTFAHYQSSLGKEEARAEALRQLAHLGSLVPDGVGRRLFAEEAGRRLGFDEGTLAREIELRRSRAGPRPGTPAPAGALGAGSGFGVRSGPARRAGVEPDATLRGGKPVPRRHPAERMLVAMALGRPWVVRQIRAELPLDAIHDAELRRMLEMLLDREAKDQSIRPADLMGPEMEAEFVSLMSALAVDPAAHEDQEPQVGPLIERLRARERARERTRLRELIREHEAAGREAEVRALLEQLASLMQLE